jgi:hypothetical protein
MERNQFFYFRREPIKPKEDAPADAPLEYDVFEDSFNINKVIRSVNVEHNKLLILLDDIHERTTDVPMQTKSGKITGYKKERGTYQSEIHLEEGDVERFRKLTSIG